MHDDSDRASYTVRGCLVERSTSAGIGVAGADAVIEQTLARDMQPNEWGAGVGIVAAQPALFSEARADLTLRSCRVERARGAGVVVSGSDGDIEGVEILDTQLTSDGVAGSGIVVMKHFYAPFGEASASIRWVTIAGGYEGGIEVFGATASIEHSRVSGILPPTADGYDAADGIIATWFDPPGVGGEFDLHRSDVTVADSHIQANERAGVSAFGSDVALSNSLLECNPIPLNSEAIAAPGTISDGGGNICACGADIDICQVLSSQLQAPSPPDPATF